MPFKTPLLTRALMLETPVRTADGAGGFSVEWTLLGHLWCDLRPRAGRVAKSEGTPVARVPVTIITRAAPQGDPRRPKAGQRLRLQDRTFPIDAVTEYDAAGKYLICTCTQELAP